MNLFILKNTVLHLAVYHIILLFHHAVHAAAPASGFEDGDGDIKGLLGMRPDLADELAPSADGDNSPFIQGNNDGDAVFPSSPPNAAASAISAATKKQNDDIECISGCKDTDQSCRARCLGVPGVAARKTPRKQDISGNLPLNWRKHSVAKETGLQNSASVLQFSPMLLVLSCLV